MTTTASSNGKTTATVETLTAEVRVLMVGSRQITLSVARQLDWTVREQMVPMGRVRLGKESDTDPLLIGRRVKDGALVLSATWDAPREQPCVIDPADDDYPITRPIIVCHQNGYWSVDGTGRRGFWPRGAYGPGPLWRLRYGRSPIHVHALHVIDCNLTHQDGSEPCPWDGNGQDVQIHTQVQRHYAAFLAAQEAYEADRALPLIVLAGLR